MTQTVAQVLQAKTVSIVTENAAYTLSLREQVVPQLESFGIEILSDDLVESEVKDFSIVIARARQHDPDVLIMLLQTGSIVLMVKQAYEAGWPVIIAGGPELANDELFRVAGPACDELIVAGSASFTYYQLVGGQMPQETLDEIGADVEEIEWIADHFKANYDPQGLGLLANGYKALGAFVALI